MMGLSQPRLVRRRPRCETLASRLLIFLGERVGEVSVSLRGDLAAFLQVSEAAGGSADVLRARNGKAPVIHWNYGRLGEFWGSLAAGTGFGLCRTLLQRDPPFFCRV